MLFVPSNRMPAFSPQVAEPQMPHSMSVLQRSDKNNVGCGMGCYARSQLPVPVAVMTKDSFVFAFVRCYDGLSVGYGCNLLDTPRESSSIPVKV